MPASPLLRPYYALPYAEPSPSLQVRLAKRWVAAQMMSNHVADEAVELLVAAAATLPSTLPPPASRLTGEAAVVALSSDTPLLTFSTI